MEKIKAIRKLKNNQYTLTTESGQKIKISEDSLVKHRLLKGEEITEALLRQIEKEAELNIGYQFALHYLNFQLRSEKELRDYLKKKEISAEGIEYVMARLRDLNLVDDLVYAESYVRTMIRTSDKGPSTIKQQLFKRGIREDHVDHALSLYSFDTQEELATRVAEKALRKYKSKSHQEQLNKTRQHLFTKGFEKDVIDLVMSQLDVEKDEDDEWDLLVVQADKLWQRHRKLEPFKKKQKIKQSLYQKGFDFDLINRYITEKEMEDE